LPLKTRRGVEFDFREKLGEVDRRFDEAFPRHITRRTARASLCVNMTGIYVTPISGSLYRFIGWEHAPAGCRTDLEAIYKLADRYADWMLPYFEAWLMGGCASRWCTMISCGAPKYIPPILVPEHVFPNCYKYLRPCWIVERRSRSAQMATLLNLSMTSLNRRARLVFAFN
jgi:hypothetical protein